MTAPAVLLERHGAIAVITLSRPDKANVLSEDMRAGLYQATRDVAADENVAAVIVTGAGKHFCGGADLREPREVRAVARKSYPCAADLSVIPQPVIAAINGAALGGGCEMALSCDFRFMAEHAVVGLTEIKFGALPLGGGTARLPRLVGLSAARRMIMTGEPVDATEAERIGLADRVVPAERLLAEAEEFAALLARHAGYALRAAKQLLNATMELDLPSALELERKLGRSMASQEQFAAARAEAARQIPAYARIFGQPGTGQGKQPVAGETAPGTGPRPPAGPPAARRADQDALPGIEVTGGRQLDAWRAGELPPVEQVRPGLWSIPVTIPRSRMRYVLAYGLELPGGVALIDTGWDAEASWDDLVRGLATAGFGVGDVRAVLATHLHTDHYGLAGRVREASGAWIGLHAQEAVMIGDRADPAARTALAEAWEQARRRMGAPGGGTGMTEARARKYIQETRPDVQIEDGADPGLPGWRLRPVWTPGHSPGHLCFLETQLGVLFAGDHVLPRITPNVSVHSRQRPNPLGDYLRSLARVGELPVKEVLPAHEYRFGGLQARVRQLLEHHEEKLSAIEQIVARSPGSSCWMIASQLDWAHPFASLTGQLQFSAARETLAHLVLLAERRRVQARESAPQLWFPLEMQDPAC